MNTKISKAFLTLYACLAVFSASSFADDTKIYSGSNSVSGTVKPNIMLLLDTSGSMADDVTYPRVAQYDPSKIYSATDKFGHTCSNNFYWSHGDDTSDTDPFGSAGCSETRQFEVADFECLTAVSSLNTGGTYYDLFTEFLGYISSPRWDNPSTGRSTNASNTPVHQECQADSGLHGKGTTTTSIVDNTGNPSYTIAHEVIVGADNGTDRIAQAGSGVSPWGPSGSTTEISWPEANGLTNDVTIFHPNYVRYLYGWEDLNTNGVYDAGEGYTDIVNDGPKIDVLKTVMTELVDSWTGVNVGIMRYNIRHGSTVVYPVVDVDTNRAALKTVIAALDANDATPHTEALYEAFNYFRGWKVEFGNANGSSHRPPASALRVDDPSTTTVDESERYASPIKFTCQANAIIHMTDGRPTRDGGTVTSGSDDDGTPFPVLTLPDGVSTTDDVDVALAAQPGFSGIGDATCGADSVNSESDGITPDHCHDELADYMYHVPQTVDILKDDKMTVVVSKEVEPIRTYTVGFDLDLPYLENTAQKGGGQYFTARNKDALKSAFNNMVDQIKNVGTKVISPPGVAVEAFSRSMHLNQLYFNLFQPGTKPLYLGNLKRFELATDSSGDVVIVDATRDPENPAIDPLTGAFRDDSRSIWSSQPDGNIVEKGGMVENFPASRNVYTYISGSDLTSTANAFVPSNTSIGTGAGELELPASEVGERDKVINWGRGLDAFDEDGDNDTTEIRHKMGDPLHSRPTLVVYDSDKNDNGNHDDPDMLVITLTNDGLLHAVDSETGVEAWSFIPKETWSVLNKARKNSQSTKIYGLDGQITPWFFDHDNDGTVGPGDWEHIYFGMRRGGRHYYALDVTSKTTPKYMWQIDGGSTGFENLGQTWGQIQRAKINLGGTDTNVLVFTGGYDLAYDTAYSTMPTATMGNDLFIVKESDGSLIWHAKQSTASDDIDQTKLQYALPAEPVVIDMNNDGYHDRIYAVDIGGQVWRFDIQNGNGSTDLVTGAVFADLSTSGGADNRKFYNQPDVAILEDGHDRYISVNVGSGHRADPLDKSINDAFFSVRDPYSYGSYNINTLISAEGDYTAAVITPAVMTDITNYTNTTIVNQQGWYYKMEAGGVGKGEKVLASSVTVDKQVLFTSYEPPQTASADGCVINVGKARLYKVSLKNGAPTTDTNNDDEIDEDDERVEETAYAGIPPSVVVLFPQATNGRPVGCVGPECSKLEFENNLRRSYWYIPNRDPAN